MHPSIPKSFCNNLCCSFSLFTDAELEEINTTTIRDVILRTNPLMTEDDIQNNPFRWLPEGNSVFLNYKVTC